MLRPAGISVIPRKKVSGPGRPSVLPALRDCLPRPGDLARVDAVHQRGGPVGRRVYAGRDADRAPDFHGHLHAQPTREDHRDDRFCRVPIFFDHHSSRPTPKAPERRRRRTSQPPVRPLQRRCSNPSALNKRERSARCLAAMLMHRTSWHCAGAVEDVETVWSRCRRHCTLLWPNSAMLEIQSRPARKHSWSSGARLRERLSLSR